MESPSPSWILRFGVFQINLAARELRKHGVRVLLPGESILRTLQFYDHDQGRARPRSPAQRSALQGPVATRRSGPVTFTNFSPLRSRKRSQAQQKSSCAKNRTAEPNQ